MSQVDPGLGAGAAGWSSFGVTGLVLAWLFFRHLPAKDAQLDRLLVAHAAAMEVKDERVKAASDNCVCQIETIVKAHTAAMQAKDDAIKAMAANHAVAMDRVVMSGQEDSRLQRESGEKRYHEAMKTLTEALGRIHDTTRESVHAIRGLAQQIAVRTRLADAVQSSEAAIWTKGLDGTLMSWNGACEKLLGWRQEEVVGRNILAHVVPPERRAEEEDVLRRIGTGQVVEEHQTERVHRDGRRVSVLVITSPIKDQSGRVIGASTIARQPESSGG